jgi:hypothetical protein
MTPLRTRMIEDMKLAGLSANTQEVYPPGGQRPDEAVQEVRHSAWPFQDGANHLLCARIGGGNDQMVKSKQKKWRRTS